MGKWGFHSCSCQASRHSMWRQASGGLGGSREDTGPAQLVLQGEMGVSTSVPGCGLEPDSQLGAPFDSLILTAAPGGGREQ